MQPFAAVAHNPAEHGAERRRYSGSAIRWLPSCRLFGARRQAGLFGTLPRLRSVRPGPERDGGLERRLMEPGALIARGRDGDIFEFGDGLVLRKTRDGRSIEHEARITRYAADHGYPVPVVQEVRANGSEIVMERIDGPLMMYPMATRPWTIPRYASLLADLHDQLHRIPAPDWLKQWSDGGDRLVHLDLHPQCAHVRARPGRDRLVERGARRGLERRRTHLRAADMPAGSRTRPLQIAAEPARVGLARLFARRYRCNDLRARIAVAAGLKALDRNMSPDEIANLDRLARRMRPGPS
jgi:hypothetical protein